MMTITTATYLIKVLSTTKNTRRNLIQTKKGDEDLATNKIQEDHFQNPIQQHHLVLMSSKARSVVKCKRELLLEEINEESNSGVEDRYDDINTDNSKSKSGVGVKLIYV